MKSLILTATLLTALSANADISQAEQENINQNTVVSLEVSDVTEAYPALPVDMIEQSVLGRLNQAGAVLSAAEVVVDKVINIGTKIWNVVDKGRPVYNFNGQTATALPQNTRRWDQLQNWRQPLSRVYSVTGKNVFGYEILRFDYRITMLYGGDVGGVGRYIGYASVQPATVNIPFLTDFSATAKVESTYNLGSRTNPVAGMILTVNVDANSKIPLVSRKTLGMTYTLDANGNIRQSN